MIFYSSGCISRDLVYILVKKNNSKFDVLELFFLFYQHWSHLRNHQFYLLLLLSKWTYTTQCASQFLNLSHVLSYIYYYNSRLLVCFLCSFFFFLSLSHNILFCYEYNFNFQFTKYYLIYSIFYRYSVVNRFLSTAYHFSRKGFRIII